MGMIPSPTDVMRNRPLYAQIRDALLSRLIDRRWPPGMLLPSEKELAAEFGVSQGTVRKVLNELAAEHLVVRHQGRGTYVAEPEEGRILFQFFRLTADDGERRLPASVVTGFSKIRADRNVRARLGLETGVRVWHIHRTRMLDDRPVIGEQLVLPASRFPDLDQLAAIPNNVYQLYATRYDTTIARAVERLKADASNADDKKVLGCKVGTPLLAIDRTAYSLDGHPVEWRLSRCLTDQFHYYSELR